MPLVTPAVSDSTARESYLALISLTGRGDAPARPGTAAADWWRAWLAANPRAKPVPWEVGERAVEAWLKRAGGG